MRVTQVLDEVPLLLQDTMLVLFLLYETLAVENGKWKPYICSLPRDADLPIEWDEARLHDLVGADQEQIEKLRSEMTSSFESVKNALIDRHPNIFQPGLFTWQAWKVCKT